MLGQLVRNYISPMRPSSILARNQIVSDVYRMLKSKLLGFTNMARKPIMHLRKQRLKILVRKRMNTILEARIIGSIGKPTEAAKRQATTAMRTLVL